MRINDLVFGVLMVLLGTVTVWASRDFPSMPRQEYGAGTFPTLIGLLLVLFGVVLALRGWQRREALFHWQSAIPVSHVLLCIAALVAATLGYILLTPVLGFPLMSVAMLTAMIGWLSGGRWRLATSTALIATLLIWLTFVELLRVPLSLGFLEEVIYG
uniref:tripartite tricarboxylate transporter TctB family protein n=1 Tax=Halomonas sp. TaxID=1486246 RepID=UPI00260419E7|nr:tripartite tricarboxylate transporter TctB family protein [Halomonas sp.]